MGFYNKVRYFYWIFEQSWSFDSLSVSVYLLFTHYGSILNELIVRTDISLTSIAHLPIHRCSALDHWLKIVVVLELLGMLQKPQRLFSTLSILSHKSDGFEENRLWDKGIGIAFLWQSTRTQKEPVQKYFKMVGFIKIF